MQPSGQVQQMLHPVQWSGPVPVMSNLGVVRLPELRSAPRTSCSRMALRHWCCRCRPDLTLRRQMLPCQDAQCEVALPHYADLRRF